MGTPRMTSSLKSLINDIKTLDAGNWQEFDNKIQVLVENTKKKDFESLSLNREIYDLAFNDNNNNSNRWNRNGWIAERVMEYLLPVFSELGDKIIKNSEIDEVICIAIKNGTYKDISILDEVAKNGSGSSQIMATNFCSVNALRTLKDHKSSKIRKIYYHRLGPVECLDEMLDDKIAGIRYEGIARAPYFYDKLKQMTKEIARGPFSLLVEKIPIDYLPMLVANRNVKNSWISRRFEKRISSGH